jgi:hypothetical protein
LLFATILEILVLFMSFLAMANVLLGRSDTWLSFGSKQNYAARKSVCRGVDEWGSKARNRQTQCRACAVATAARLGQHGATKSMGIWRRSARHYDDGHNLYWGTGAMRMLLGMSNMDGNAVANDAKELVRLCRAGRLYEIERWIADGRSLDISEAIKRGRQRNLLEIAVDKSGHWPSHSGNVRSAISTTCCNLSRLAPPAAWTAIP